MAYVPLTTQSAGQTASATGWANVVKANFEAMGPHLIARKTSDESVASSTTLQDDDTLQLPVAANEIWQVRYVLKMTIPVTPQAKMAFTFPASGDISVAGTEFNAAGTMTKISFQGTTTPTATQDLLGSSANRTIVLEGVFVNASTAGTLILQWAQNVSNASATIMKAQSTLWGMNLLDLVGLGDVIELSRRQLFKVGVLLGVLPHHKPWHTGGPPKPSQSSGLLLIWN